MLYQDATNSGGFCHPAGTITQLTQSHRLRNKNEFDIKCVMMSFQSEKKLPRDRLLSNCSVSLHILGKCVEIDFEQMKTYEGAFAILIKVLG